MRADLILCTEVEHKSVNNLMPAIVIEMAQRRPTSISCSDRSMKCGAGLSFAIFLAPDGSGRRQKDAKKRIALDVG
jgi:hypothetical protein